MFDQIVFGTLLILATVLASVAIYAVLEGLLGRNRPWLHREPHLPKLILALAVSVVFSAGDDHRQRLDLGPGLPVA